MAIVFLFIWSSLGAPLYNKRNSIKLVGIFHREKMEEGLEGPLPNFLDLWKERNRWAFENDEMLDKKKWWDVGSMVEKFVPK